MQGQHVHSHRVRRSFIGHTQQWHQRCCDIKVTGDHIPLLWGSSGNVQHHRGSRLPFTEFGIVAPEPSFHEFFAMIAGNDDDGRFKQVTLLQKV